MLGVAKLLDHLDRSQLDKNIGALVNAQRRSYQPSLLVQGKYLLGTVPQSNHELQEPQLYRTVFPSRVLFHLIQHLRIHRQIRVNRRNRVERLQRELGDVSLLVCEQVADVQNQPLRIAGDIEGVCERSSMNVVS
jgi:hypothetical protein